MRKFWVLLIAAILGVISVTAYSSTPSEPCPSDPNAPAENCVCPTEGIEP